jgi:hypothetical protein
MYDQLSDDALLKLLSTEEDRLPRAAVDEFLRRGGRMAAPLLRIVDDRGLWDSPPPGCYAPTHAAFLLAALQPPDALVPLLRAIHIAFELQETFVTDYADLILARFGPDALPSLIPLSRKRSEPFELRITVNEAIARIGLVHRPARAAARDHLLAVARDQGEDPELRNLAAHGFVEYATKDDRETLRELEDEDLLDKEAAALAVAGRYPAHYGSPIDLLELYDPDAVEERRKFWNEVEESAPEAELPDDPSLEALSRLDAADAPPAPLVNAAPKVGRNDPCPCGSGKKHKKCCGN